MESPKGDISPPRDLSRPNIFKIDFFMPTYNQRDLKRKNILSENILNPSIDFLSDNQNMGQFFEWVLERYKKFIATKPIVRYGLTGKAEIDERNYFISPKDLEDELREILNMAEEGDILVLQNDAFYITVKDNSLSLEVLHSPSGDFNNFLPKEAINAVIKYNIEDRYDIHKYYPGLQIQGIYIPSSYIPRNQRTNYVKMIFEFGTKDRYDLVINLDPNHKLYLIKTNL